MAEKLTLWAVYTNDDLTEGRGRQFVKHFCKMESTAIRLAKKGYVQGTDCPVEPVDAFCVDGKYFLPTSILNIVPPSPEDEARQRMIDARKLALKKAKALGLSDEEIALLVKGPSQ
ncbi:hypothetical protein FBZ98_101982 [Rhizobium sp. ERR 922]|uniref:hypothetical protein n=1 Tax=unclassified Rhizobium TaxID=2613769 RepID=UPI00119CC4E1|nr:MULTISPECIES: hypothetical protein [unclassified Rhizobium]TWB61637.1 hypothetical protein FBZ98_101982 [Rhizobium sp. ERR 922]TWC04563.1 hypothetical protein FBZ97_101982 [Rhizobium sp. ERR 942]